MRRIACVCLVAIIFSVCASTAAAQQKPKDPVLQAEMQNQFARMTEALNQIMTRLGAIEAEVARLKQVESDGKNTQTMLKATDEKVAQLKEATTRDLIDLKRDMTSLRSDVITIGGDVRRGMSAQAPQQQAPGGTTQAPLPEGYITEVTENEVSINLGSAAGVREGMRFAVFHASDPKTEIGRISIKTILDGNNSKCEITSKRSDVKFEFSDIVKPL